jgi:hypothetical protein
MLLLVLQLLSIAFLLIAIGEPVRFLFFKRFGLFSDLDLIQICVFNVYVGCLILYVIAMLPFRLFNWLVVVGFTALSLVLSFVLHHETLKNLCKMLKAENFFKRINKKAFLGHLFLFIIFVIFLLINLFSVSNFVFGSIRDESIHSLYVQVILENGCVPLTLQPYLPEGIIYPQAAHVIFAFASYFLSMEIPHVVLYVTILFKSLSIVAIFFFGMSLGFDEIYSVGLSFVFAFISSWPLFITWGGNPFTVGFPLFFICLGLFFSLFCSGRKNSYLELLVVGLLFGYLGAIIISYLQVFMVVAFFIFIYYVARKCKIGRILFEFVIIFVISLLPLSPFLYRFFAFYPYPGHNIGVPSDFTQWDRPQFYITQALQWAFDNLSPYPLLQKWTVLLLVGFAILFFKVKERKDVGRIVAFASVIFISSMFLSFLSFFLPADFGVVSWGHQGVIMSIFVNLLIFAFYVKVAKIFGGWIKNRISKVFVFANKRLSISSILTFMLLLTITAPFLYYRFAVDPIGIQGAYGVYAVTTVDDYNLMLWMRENLSSDAVILVHPYEGGLFIPTISHHRIVFPYSGSTLSRRYQNVVRLMENKTMNVTTYELMQDLGVSHVFVGAQVASCEGYFMWVPELFLGNPNFKLVKNFGRAYLFELNYTDPNIVFLDDFEYDIWDQNLWWAFSFGQGLGNVSITEEHGYMGSQCLRIKAEMLPTVWNWQYAYGVGRRIFVSNASEVDFSFHFNATQGFSGKDTFAVLISNIYHNQSLVVATNNPHGVYENYASIIVLNEGFFEFKGNQSLSALWFERFNSTLPNTFILDFVVLDLDGIENIVYIDNVQVTLVPLPVQDEVG